MLSRQALSILTGAALMMAIISAFTLGAISSATCITGGHPQLELANPIIGPNSELPAVGGAVPYSEPTQPAGSPLGQTFLLGTTWYDYQHNGTGEKMIFLTPSRGVHFSWMNGLQALAIDRHIFYNYYNADTGYLGWPDIGYPVEWWNRAGYTTLSSLNSGEAVIAYHSRSTAGSGYKTQVAYDFLEGFGAFQYAELNNPSGWDELSWPHVGVCRQNFIHVVSTESRETSWQRIAYARSQDGGTSYTPFAVIDTLLTISPMVAASPVSDKVGIAYCKSEFDPLNLGPYDGLLVSQLNNGITLVESQDGTNWNFTDRRDVTQLVNPDTSRYPDTTYANGDTLRAYCDVSLLYDQSDKAHVAFTTRYLGFDARLAAYPDSFAITGTSLDASIIWHWNEALDTMTVVAEGWYDVGATNVGANKYRGAGAWRSTVDRPSLGQDPVTGYLYCLYVKCLPGDTSGGPIPSHGFANGELYCSVSTDGGINWSQGTNLTNTPSPGAMPGNCMDEDYPSLAAVVNDTLHIIYVEDKDAGGVVQTAPQEGTWTENPVKYLRVPVSLAPPGPPYMTNFSFHVGPPDGVPVVLSSFHAVGGQGHIALQWVTASEVGCHRWEIYRRRWEDGEYEKLGQLSGQGSVETGHTYRWVDRRVVPGVTYFYKLRQVDFDGTWWWSPLVSAAATASGSVPETYALYQNYPNPFNPVTEIRYSIPGDEHVTLRVYNILGAEVATLVDADQQADVYRVGWNAAGMASGVYLCTLRAGSFETSTKMVLMK